MGLRRFADLALALVLLVPPMAVAQNGARTFYCCDVNGQPMCGDVLPQACYGRAYREISPQGTVRREIAAPLTAEEIARRDEEMRRRRLLEAESLKQQRLDRALLETYRDLPDLDYRRDRALGELDRSIATLRARESDLVLRQRALIQESAAIESRTVREGIAEDIRNLDGEIVAQRSVIDAKVRERDAVRSRFEEDRRRYIELTAPSIKPPAAQGPKR
ncbi:MAG: hypothetical protein J0M28_09800 [Thauera sp.]|nr:hypothetical protein [Thauera sp.]